jgi:hypothetical protein
VAPTAPARSSSTPAVSTPSSPSVTQARSSTPGVSGVPFVSALSGSQLGGGSAGPSFYAASASSSPESGEPKAEQLRSSRRWISTSGPKRRRATTFTFLLPRAGRVDFVVRQVSPVCRNVGRFTVKGHAGLNRVRFPRRASKLHLEPGTYTITARTRAGRMVQRATILVVDGGTPTPDQIAAARASNLCTAAARLATASGSTGASNTGNVSSAPQQVQGSFTPGQPSASGPNEGTNSHSGGVLASSVEKAARVVQPLLVALLLLAIILLGVASLPRVALPESRANQALARHRVGIAGLGAAAFVAVVIAFLLG